MSGQVIEHDPYDPSAVSTEDDGEHVPDAMDAISYPEGGFAAWMTVAGSWFTLFSTFGYLYSFGVYQDFYTTNYLSNSSASKIAWIGSVQLMTPFFLGIISGKLFDDGHFRFLESFGSLFFVFSLFMLSLAKPYQYYQVFLAQGLGMGIGLGLLFVPAVSIISQYFRRRRGLATGIALSGSSTGAVIFPIMLNHLIPTLGFARAVRATAYMVLGMLIIGNVLMRPRLSGRRAHARVANNGPEDEYALGIKGGSNGRAQEGDRDGEYPAPREPPADIKAVLTDVTYLLATFGGLIASFGLYFPYIYIQLFATAQNVDPTLVFYALPILNASSILGRVLGNHMSDLWGAYNIFAPCNIVIGAIIIAFLGIKDAGSLVVVSILYGIFSGAWLALAFATLGSLARSQNEVGIRVGFALAVASLGCLFSSPVQGALLGSRFDWNRPVAFSATLMFVSGVVSFIVRMSQARRLGKWAV